MPKPAEGMIFVSDLITIKGLRNGVTLILNDSEPDFQEILEQLKAKLSSTSFLKNTFVNVDIGAREALSAGQLASLKEILSARNIQLKNVILNGHKTGDVSKVKKVIPQKLVTERGKTLMVNRTIRSGQSLYYPGSIVLMGDVHPGGEISARENIIVWGALRGVAHAGNGGNEKAFIIALQLAPSQLRIAHYIACSPEQSPVMPQKPEIAYVIDKRIVVEEYSSGRNILTNIHARPF